MPLFHVPLNVSAGELKAVANLMENNGVDEGVKITYVKDRQALEFHSNPEFRGYINLEYYDCQRVGDKIEGKAWSTTPEELKKAARLIPDDVLFWEARKLSLDMEVMDYEIYVGGISNKTDRRKEDREILQTLWNKDKEYRRLKHEQVEAEDHSLPHIFLFLFSDQIEFTLSFNEEYNIAAFTLR